MWSCNQHVCVCENVLMGYTTINMVTLASLKSGGLTAIGRMISQGILGHISNAWSGVFLDVFRCQSVAIRNMVT